MNKPDIFHPEPGQAIPTVAKIKKQCRITNLHCAILEAVYDLGVSPEDCEKFSRVISRKRLYFMVNDIVCDTGEYFALVSNNGNVIKGLSIDDLIKLAVKDIGK